jgi:hypothetical protein
MYDSTNSMMTSLDVNEYHWNPKLMMKFVAMKLRFCCTKIEWDITNVLSFLKLNLAAG